MKIKFSYYIISITIRNNAVSFPSGYTLCHAPIYDICRQDGNLIQSIQKATQCLALYDRKGSETFAKIQSLWSAGFNALLTEEKHQGNPLESAGEPPWGLQGELAPRRLPWHPCLRQGRGQGRSFPFTGHASLFFCLFFGGFFCELAVSSPSKMGADNALLTTLITPRNKWSTNLWVTRGSHVSFALSVEWMQTCKVYFYKYFSTVYRYLPSDILLALLNLLTMPKFTLIFITSSGFNTLSSLNFWVIAVSTICPALKNYLNSFK